MRAIIVEHNPIIREGLRSLLSESPIEIVGVYASLREAVTQLKSLAPDVAFVGARGAAGRGLSPLQPIKRACPGTAIVLLGTNQDHAYLVQALTQGASCYLCQDITSESLVLAAEAAKLGLVMVDGQALSGALRTLLERQTGREGQVLASLTAREREVLRLVSQGRSNRQIAARLNITQATVRTHVSHILAKLGVSDRVQAAVWAVQHASQIVGPDSG